MGICELFSPIGARGGREPQIFLPRAEGDAALDLPTLLIGWHAYDLVHGRRGLGFLRLAEFQMNGYRSQHLQSARANAGPASTAHCSAMVFRLAKPFSNIPPTMRSMFKNSPTTFVM
jgi:hypothetical protein